MEKVYIVYKIKTGSVYAVCGDAEAALHYLNELENVHNITGGVKQHKILFAPNQ